MFQWIENQVDQALVMYWGDDARSRSWSKLSKLRFSTKIDRLLAEFRTNKQNARGRTRAEWVASFEELVADLHEARGRRNRLLHAQFIDGFMAIGQPLLLVDRINTEAPLTEMSAEWRDEQAKWLAELAFRVSVAVAQLRSDHGQTAT